MKLLRSVLALCALVSVAAFSPVGVMPTRSATARSVPAVQMSRVCAITGKRANNANRVTFSNKKHAYWQQPNIQKKKFFSPALNRVVRIKVATSTMRTIRKLGIDKTAEKYGCDLSKF